MRRSGFTLMEVLVSLILGSLVIALAGEALFRLKRSVDRQTALLDLHSQAHIIHQVLSRDFSSIHPGGAFHIRCTDGRDGLPGTGDDGLEVDALVTLTTVADETWSYGADHLTDVTWVRLAYTRDSAGLGSLSYARCIGPRIHGRGLFYAQPRRDRRRDLNDNDLRHAPGATLADVTSAAVDGDGAVLAQRLLPLHDPRFTIDDVRVSLVDLHGRSTTVGPGGAETRTVTGTLTSLPGSPWSNARRVGLDGIYLDGRPRSLPADPEPIADRRPALIRISFSISDAPQHPAGSPRILRQDFAFSFSAGTIPGAVP